MKLRASLAYARPVIIGLAAAYVVFLTGVFFVMRQPPARFGQIMKRMPLPLLMFVPFESMWTVARDGQLRIGDVAPEFNLRTADKAGHIRLSTFRGRKPVVLVFGSYT